MVVVVYLAGELPGYQFIDLDRITNSSPLWFRSLYRHILIIMRCWVHIYATTDHPSKLIHTVSVFLAYLMAPSVSKKGPAKKEDPKKGPVKKKDPKKEKAKKEEPKKAKAKKEEPKKVKPKKPVNKPKPSIIKGTKKKKWTKGKVGPHNMSALYFLH